MSRIAGLLGVLFVATLAVLAAPQVNASAQQQGECPIQVDLFSALAVGDQIDVCELTVTKTLTSGNPVAVGSNVVFQIVVENTGNVSLSNVSLADTYDHSHIDFQSANPAPTATDEADGILEWDDLLPSPDGDDVGVWDPGESRTVTATFRALAVDGAGNCTIGIAEAIQYEDDIASEFSCADVRIVPGSGGRQEPTNTPPAATATRPPSTSPTPVVSVAPATVVPPTPRPVGVTAPDTGTGDGSGVPASPLTIVIVAGALLALGAAVVRTAGKRA